MAKKNRACSVDMTAFTGLLVMLMQTINAACRVSKEPGLTKELPRKLQDVARDCYQVFVQGCCLYGAKVPKLKKGCRLNEGTFMAMVKSMRAGIESALLLTDPVLEPELTRRHVEIIVDCAILHSQSRCLLSLPATSCETPRRSRNG
jgi:hypothetical protein